MYGYIATAYETPLEDAGGISRALTPPPTVDVSEGSPLCFGLEVI